MVRGGSREAAGLGVQVRAWDAETGLQVKKMAEHDSFVNTCCPLRRGPPLLVSGSDDGTAKVKTVPVLHEQLLNGFDVDSTCHTAATLCTNNPATP